MFFCQMFQFIRLLNNYYGQDNVYTLICSKGIYIHCSQYKRILLKIKTQNNSKIIHYFTFMLHVLSFKIFFQIFIQFDTFFNIQ